MTLWTSIAALSTLSLASKFNLDIIASKVARKDLMPNQLCQEALRCAYTLCLWQASPFFRASRSVGCMFSRFLDILIVSLFPLLLRSSFLSPDIHLIIRTSKTITKDFCEIISQSRGLWIWFLISRSCTLFLPLSCFNKSCQFTKTGARRRSG